MQVYNHCENLNNIVLGLEQAATEWVVRDMQAHFPEESIIAVHDWRILPKQSNGLQIDAGAIGPIAEFLEVKAMLRKEGMMQALRNRDKLWCALIRAAFMCLASLVCTTLAISVPQHNTSTRPMQCRPMHSWPPNRRLHVVSHRRHHALESPS